MKIELSEEQWRRMADREGDSEVGAGLPTDGTIYQAVSQRDMTPEERAELDAAIEEIAAGHPQHKIWRLLYPHFGERADFIVSIVAPFLKET